MQQQTTEQLKAPAAKALLDQIIAKRAAARERRNGAQALYERLSVQRVLGDRRGVEKEIAAAKTELAQAEEEVSIAQAALAEAERRAQAALSDDAAHAEDDAWLLQAERLAKLDELRTAITGKADALAGLCCEYLSVREQMVDACPNFETRFGDYTPKPSMIDRATDRLLDLVMHRALRFHRKYMQPPAGHADTDAIERRELQALSQRDYV